MLLFHGVLRIQFTGGEGRGGEGRGQEGLGRKGQEGKGKNREGEKDAQNYYCRVMLRLYV